jgi:hypothetical protein
MSLLMKRWRRIMFRRWRPYCADELIDSLVLPLAVLFELRDPLVLLLPVPFSLSVLMLFFL